jgi:hypothetical protein
MQNLGFHNGIVNDASVQGCYAFGIIQQQHVHCHRKIHTQNACHNIPRGKTQKAF